MSDINVVVIQTNYQKYQKGLPISDSLKRAKAKYYQKIKNQKADAAVEKTLLEKTKRKHLLMQKQVIKLALEIELLEQTEIA